LDKEVEYSIYGDWEMIERNSGIKKFNSILATYKCKRCGNLKNMIPSQLIHYRVVCETCKNKFYKNHYIGMTFGKLKIVEYLGLKDKYYYYKCICSCKTDISDREFRLSNLLNGNSESCGCEQNKQTHGLTNTRIYKIYRGMIRRCYNLNESNYDRYGGRGIFICDEWLIEENDQGLKNFYNWSIRNGYNEDLSIDRIDNDGPYAPWNCRWTTDNVQANNTSTNHIININGYDYTISQIAYRYSIEYNWLSNKINKGISINEIIKDKKEKPIRFIE